MGAGVMGLVAGVSPADVVTSFTNGFGKTTGAVGLLVALGAMIGTLLRDSGGSETIVDKLIGQEHGVAAGFRIAAGAFVILIVVSTRLIRFNYLRNFHGLVLAGRYFRAANLGSSISQRICCG